MIENVVHFPCYTDTNFIWMAADIGDHSGWKPVSGAISRLRLAMGL